MTNKPFIAVREISPHLWEARIDGWWDSPRIFGITAQHAFLRYINFIQEVKYQKEFGDPIPSHVPLARYIDLLCWRGLMLHQDPDRESWVMTRDGDFRGFILPRWRHGDRQAQPSPRLAVLRGA